MTQRKQLLKVVVTPLKTEARAEMRVPGARVVVFADQEEPLTYAQTLWMLECAKHNLINGVYDE